MYGSQDASAIWQGDYTKLLLSSGFIRGSANASFYHPDWDVRVLVHGDDFVCLGDTDNLQKTEQSL